MSGILLLVVLIVVPVGGAWLITRPRAKRRRKAMDEMVGLYGEDQLRGMTLEQAVFAARCGLLRRVDL